MSSIRLETIIRDNLNRLPAEPFIWWQKTWWSRGAFLELVEECEERLRTSNFKQGQRLALLTPNSPILLATAVAVWRLGGAIVLIDPRSGYVPLIRQLRHADVFAVLVSRGCDELAPLVSEEGIPCSAISLDTLEDNIPGRPCDEEDPETAVIFYTSGITGEPNAVPLTHANLLACIDGCVGHIDMLDEDDVILNALPNSNSFGFVCGALLPLVKAARQVVLPSFMPVETSMDAIKQADVSIVMAEPTMIAMMSASVLRVASAPSKLKCVLSGADKLPCALRRRAEAALQTRVIQGYGLTEAASVVALTPGLDKSKPDSVGTVISCVEAEIRGDSGEALPAGREGQLWVRGASVARGYYRSPELTEGRFRGGWFRTGDVARFDGDGYLYIVSRTAEVIFVGGFKVYSREVERALEEHHAVKEAAVVGVPRSTSGEIVKAFVVLRNGERASSKELIDYCKKKLSYYKVPRIIEFISKMPRSAIGEIVKRNLSKD